MGALFRYFSKILTPVLLLAVTVAGISYLVFRTSLPKLSGSLAIRGIQYPVDLVRDANGVPHIFAESETDALIALGYVHAQDRLWQLELHRRTASGRLSEILGADLLQHDKLVRTIGLRRFAETAWSRLRTDVRRRVEAYSNGINAFLESRNGVNPIEFWLPGAPDPAPWTGIDSLAWLNAMAWDLNKNAMYREIERLGMAKRLPPRALDELYVRELQAYQEPFPDLNPLYFSNISRDRLQVQTDVLETLSGPLLDPISGSGEAASGAGSNAWIIAGSKTVLGAPILANDPHLGLTSPSIWYHVHLSIRRGFDGLPQEILGATVPGIPGVVLGRTEDLAWGLTSAMLDSIDLFVEEWAGKDRVRTPEGTSAVTRLNEVIAVRDQKPQSITITSTGNGPVVSDLFPGLQTLLGPERALSMRWTLQREVNRTVSVGLNVLRVRNLKNLADAFAPLIAPAQIVTAADRNGKRVQFVTGEIPARQREQRFRGFLPSPAFEAKNVWRSQNIDGSAPGIPVISGSSDWMAAANQRFLPLDHTADTFSFDWAADYRYRRIANLLNGQTGPVDAEVMSQIQQDRVSGFAREITPLLIEFIVANGKTEIEALDSLRTWDGAMDGEKSAPLVFWTWIQELYSRITAEEFGRHIQVGLRSAFIRKLLMSGESIWCSDARVEVVPAECKTHIQRSFSKAVDRISNEFGERPANWHWMDAHSRVSRHVPFSYFEKLRYFFEISQPTGGAMFTIDNTSVSFKNTKEVKFTAKRGSSVRHIMDLGTDDLLFVTPTGQSGNPLSPFFDNFSTFWDQNEYLTIHRDRKTVEDTSIGTLTLTPFPPNQESGN